MQVTHGDGVMMAIEAAAAGTKTYPIFEEVLAPSGKIVQCGMGADRVPISVLKVQWQRLHIHGSVGHSGGIFPYVDPPARFRAHQPAPNDHGALHARRGNRRRAAGREATRRQGHGAPVTIRDWW